MTEHVCECGHGLDKHDLATGLCLACVPGVCKGYYEPISPDSPVLERLKAHFDNLPTVPIAGPVEVKPIPKDVFSYAELEDGIELRIKLDKKMLDITELEQGKWPVDIVAGLVIRAGIWGVVGALAKTFLPFL